MLSAVFVTWGTALSRPHHFVEAAAQTLGCHSKDFPYSMVSFKHTAKIQERQPPTEFLGESGLCTSSLRLLLPARCHTGAQWNPAVHRGRGVKRSWLSKAGINGRLEWLWKFEFHSGMRYFLLESERHLLHSFWMLLQYLDMTNSPCKNEVSLHSRQYFL